MSSWAETTLLRQKRKLQEDPSNFRCQKCFKLGHWTYKCKSQPVYIQKPSYTEELLHPIVKSVPVLPPPEKQIYSRKEDLFTELENYDEVPDNEIQKNDDSSSIPSSESDEEKETKKQSRSRSQSSSSSLLDTSSDSDKSSYSD